MGADRTLAPHFPIAPVRVGITSVAAAALGELVFVDLPEVGSTIVAANPAVKWNPPRRCPSCIPPVSGHRHRRSTTAAVDDPSLVASDPYGAGWLFEVAADRGRNPPDRSRIRREERGVGMSILDQRLDRFRPRGRRGDRRRTAAAAGRAGDDRVGEPRSARGHAGAGIGADQQVRRRLPGSPLLRRLRTHRRDRASRHRPSEGTVRCGIRERATTFGRASQRRGDARPDQAG